MAHLSLCGVVTELVEAVGQLKQHALMFVVGHIIGQCPQLGCRVIPTLWVVKFSSQHSAQLSTPPWATNASRQSEFLKGSYDSHRPT